MEPSFQRNLAKLRPPYTPSSPHPGLSALLVSVRSDAEAGIALAGGAELIDIKEPRLGSLGRAAPAVIRAVADRVAGRCPVSAALGELRDSPPPPDLPGLAFAKWGLSGCAGQPEWQRHLARAGDQLRRANRDCRPVAVAFADWERARAPSPADVWQFALDHGWDVLLLDTWRKDGSTLLDWLPLSELARLRELSLRAGIRVAFAGSLGPEEMRVLLPLRPDWFAVRGAVCRGSRREGEIHGPSVRQLVEWLQGSGQ
jgi:(5-formylfuran-3-yl)methyl phosphate synthase